MQIFLESNQQEFYPISSVDKQAATTTTPSQETIMSKTNESEDITIVENNSQIQNVPQNDKADSIQAEIIDQEPLDGDQNTIRKQPVSTLEAGSKIKTSNFKKAIVQHSKFYMVKRKKKKKKDYGNRESNNATEEFAEECCAIYLARKTYKLLTWARRHFDCIGDCDCDCCGSGCESACDSDDDC